MTRVSVTSVADHCAGRDVYGLIVSALERASKSLDSLTVEDLAPVDHFHDSRLSRHSGPRGSAARRPRRPPTRHRLRGRRPARYFVQRFGCRVSGIDITGPFVEAASKLTALLDMGDRVVVEQGTAGGSPTQTVASTVPTLST
jgi:hypothetical protein